MQNQIPNNWQTIKLKDYTSKIGSGATPRGGEKVYLKEGISLIRSQNIYNNSFEKQGLTFITVRHADELKNVEVHAGDILLNITGDSVARSCEVDQSILPARVNQHVAIIRTKDSLDHKFLKYYLVSPYMQSIMLSQASTGGTRNALTKDMIENFEIPYPPVTDQRKIAQILQSFDDKIEINNNIAKTLEDMAQAIFKEWFTKNTDKLQAQKIKNLGRVVTGKTPSTKDLMNFGSEYPFVTIPDMTNTFILNADRYLSQKSADRMKNLVLPEGSICVSCIATVGLVSITTDESITNQQINSIIPNNEEFTYFLYLFLRKNKETLQSYAAGGSTTLIINKSQFENLDISVPDSLTLKKFHQMVKPMYKKTLAVLKENQRLEAMRDLLLPKLMRGEIRV